MVHDQQRIITVKITKRQLLRIIREEKTRLKEQTVGVEDVTQTEDAFGGGDDEGEAFVDAILDDLNVFADEVGRVDDIGKTAVDVVEDREEEELAENRKRLKSKLRRLVREQAEGSAGGLPNPSDLAKKMSSAGPEAAISFLGDLMQRLTFSGAAPEEVPEVIEEPALPPEDM